MPATSIPAPKEQRHGSSQPWAQPCAAPRGKTIVRGSAKPASLNAARNQRREAAASPSTWTGEAAGTRYSSRHPHVRLHILCRRGNDMSLEQCEPQPRRSSKSSCGHKEGFGIKQCFCFPQPFTLGGAQQLVQMSPRGTVLGRTAPPLLEAKEILLWSWRSSR